MQIVKKSTVSRADEQQALQIAAYCAAWVNCMQIVNEKMVCCARSMCQHFGPTLPPNAFCSYFQRHESGPQHNTFLVL
jgi:hypothetical protein